MPQLLSFACFVFEINRRCNCPDSHINMYKHTNNDRKYANKPTHNSSRTYLSFLYLIACVLRQATLISGVFG